MAGKHGVQLGAKRGGYASRKEGERNRKEIELSRAALETQVFDGMTDEEWCRYLDERAGPMR